MDPHRVDLPSPEAIEARPHVSLHGSPAELDALRNSQFALTMATMTQRGIKLLDTLPEKVQREYGSWRPADFYRAVQRSPEMLVPERVRAAYPPHAIARPRASRRRSTTRVAARGDPSPSPSPLDLAPRSGGGGVTPREREREWFDIALHLDAENRELRAIATSLFFWLATNQELFAVARAAIARRWPQPHGGEHR
jgi:hypothetical protein